MTALSQEAFIAFKITFTVMVIVNIAGNSLVCLSVRRFPWMQTPMNYLLVHLAVCDILGGLFTLPRVILQGLYDHPDGLTGDVLCIFLTHGNLGWLCCCVSVYTLLAIAFERYTAIVKPHAPRFTRKKIQIVIVASWLIGGVVCLPETTATAYNSKTKWCGYVWMWNWLPVFDSMLWLMVACIIPVSTLIVLYGRIIQMLWFSNDQVENISQRSLMKSRKRITRVVLTVTVILFVCWIPNLLYYAISVFLSRQSIFIAEDRKIIAPVWFQVSLVLLLLNSSINPFIYALQDIRFRRCMRRLLCGTGSNHQGGNIPDENAQ
ncbi:tachykinin-like peptides receptor 86C [Exaiptasia diaphana]|uniref:G-protein coupled receptors family 1 profile domain-containing protein n=1 Tax=Exaiptasia diaphana TaxID=2652724 RepID=A0A913Y305_EXADI|nr:tachykinin-like peptides receptor 86C [Exaiptasia diaphana]